MKALILKSVIKIDMLFARIFLSLFNEKKSLIAVYIHGLFKDKNEIDFNVIYPQQSMTTDIFRQFIEYFLDFNYSFISSHDIINGLDTTKNYILITFDDGYYNNHLALPILKEYKIPCTFFISSNHILENKSYWWDVIYRERLKKHINLKKIRGEVKYLEKKKTSDIEEYLIDNFGNKAMSPICDIDRPFTPSELASFSQEQLVTIGNHTSNHAILTNYAYNEIESEILNCQEAIYNITGQTPFIICYPNGKYSPDVLKISKANGLKLGVTAHPAKNTHPINLQGINSLLLNRYLILGDINVRNQCLNFRNDIQVYPVLRSIFKRRL